jgi:hypothetical protein
MISLVESIGQRLGSSAYVNEAAITHGIVMPVLTALGWDTADPQQVHPEFANARGRVDFALMGVGKIPAVFIEVKAVGRSLDGDKQLFEYAFHTGVPLCVLTDGREWNFYLPSGLGTYNDRRIYRLQLDDRAPAECEAVFIRYLQRARILDRSAFSDAQADYLSAAGRRQARLELPAAWAELLEEGNDHIIDTLADKAEARCGFKPDAQEVLAFLRSNPPGRAGASVHPANGASKPPLATQPVAAAATETSHHSAPGSRDIAWRVLGTTGVSPTAAAALVDVLRAIVATDPTLIPELSKSARTRGRSLIDRTPELINPARPDLARAVEISPGWLVGLNLSNADKWRVLMAACATYNFIISKDVVVTFPNVTSR